MAEQQQDEVGPASVLAWSKGSRASLGWRGHGRRARDAIGRRRDLCGAWRGSWSGSTTSRRQWRSEREALDAGTHAPSGARGRQEARQGDTTAKGHGSGGHGGKAAPWEEACRREEARRVDDELERELQRGVAERQEALRSTEEGGEAARGSGVHGAVTVAGGEAAVA